MPADSISVPAPTITVDLSVGPAGRYIEASGTLTVRNATSHIRGNATMIFQRRSTYEVVPANESEYTGSMDSIDADPVGSPPYELPFHVWTEGNELVSTGDRNTQYRYQVMVQWGRYSSPPSDEQNAIKKVSGDYPNVAFGPWTPWTYVQPIGQVFLRNPLPD